MNAGELPVVLGYLFRAVVLASLLALEPVSAHGQRIDQSISDCGNGRSETVELSQEKITFCIPLTNDSWVWMEAVSGTNFTSMANLCCQEVAEVLKLWKPMGTTQAGRWYPIAVKNLKNEVAEKIGAVLPPVPEREESVDDDPSPSPRAPSEQEGEPPTRTPTAPLSDGKETQDFMQDPRILKAVIFVILMWAVAATMWAIRKAGDKATKNNKTKSSEEGRRRSAIPDEVELTKWREIAALLTDPLITALEQVNKIERQQKILVDLAPPDLSKAEWINFINTFKRELYPPSLQTPSGRDYGPQRFSPPGTLVDGRHPPADETFTPSGRQIYVVRGAKYTDGSNNFGGMIVFSETQDNSVGFCIRQERETNWLIPNPNAREYDPLYQTLFGISKGEFPVQTRINPQPVRREGGQWVLVSQS